MKVILIVALAVVACVAKSPVNDEKWDEFKAQFGKTYSSPTEETVRYRYFKENSDFIEQHNSAAEQNFTLGMNEYGDMSENEFVSFFLGYRQWPEEEPREEPRLFQSLIGDLPATVDWVTKGYVTPIKNQGACGSCWSFSATGSLEGQHFKKTGNLVSLSEQNLVDCSKKEGDHGCEGGLMDFAFEYVEKNGGIDTEESYPYKGKDGKCKFTEANVGAKCTGKVDIKKGSEADLQKAVAEVGPISVAIDASSKEFRFYKSGVLNDHKCSSKKLDHGVLAVGYGTLSGDDYWLVKNSWGKSWGAKGYIMMSRNKDNQCGIATAASYPLM